MGGKCYSWSLSNVVFLDPDLVLENRETRINGLYNSILPVVSYSLVPGLSSIQGTDDGLTSWRQTPFLRPSESQAQHTFQASFWAAAKCQEGQLAGIHVHRIPGFTNLERT